MIPKGRGIRHRDKHVSEIIGRGRFEVIWPSSIHDTYDWTRGDYVFWDHFRRGLREGFEFGGIYAKRITELLSGYVLGVDGPSITLEQAPDSEDPDDPVNYTNSKMQRFFRRYFSTLTSAINDLYALGDQYIVLDLQTARLGFPPPNLVTPTYNAQRQLTSLTIETRTPKETIIETLTPEQRVITIRRGTKEDTTIYPNLLGIIPAVHFANLRSAGEIYGRPEYEALLLVFSQYDDALTAALDGVRLMGRPVPVFKGNPNTIETEYESSDQEEYKDAFGNYQNRTTIDFDTSAGIIMGEGGGFEFVSPGSFTQDTRNMLEILFLLIIDHTGIPEVVWGNKAEGRASAETQMSPFLRFIEWKRTELEGLGRDDEMGYPAQGGLLALADIFLRQQALTDPGIVVGPTVLDWPDLAQEDAQLTLNWAQYLYGMGLLRRETLLRISRLVDDPKSELEVLDLETADDRQRDAEEAADAAAFESAFETALCEAGDDGRQ